MKMSKTLNRVVGFTLIELMIVIAIIGVLAAVAIPQYQKYATRAKVNQAFNSIRAIQLAMNEYALVNQNFPANASQLPGIAANITNAGPGAEDTATCSGDIASIDYNAVAGATTASIDVNFYTNATAISAACFDGVNAATAQIPQPLSGNSIRFIATINQNAGNNLGNVLWGIEPTGANTTVPAQYIPAFGSGTVAAAPANPNP